MTRAGHIARIVVAYALCCLPPAIWVAFDLAYGGYTSEGISLQTAASNFLVNMAGLMAVVALLMALPAAGAIWLAERRRWTSPLIYLAFGAFAPAIIFPLLALPDYFSATRRAGFDAYLLSMMLEFGMLGLISGAIYWAIAGRRSGALRDVTPAPRQPA